MAAESKAMYEPNSKFSIKRGITQWRFRRQEAGSADLFEDFDLFLDFQPKDYLENAEKVRVRFKLTEV